MKFACKAFSSALVLATACASFTASAQRTNGISIHFGGNDFYGPQTSNYFSNPLHRVSYNVESGNLDTTSTNVLHWNPLVRLGYLRRLNKFLDLNLTLSGGNVDMPESDKDSAFIYRKDYNLSSRENYLLGQADARLNVNLLDKERYVLSPYIFAGISVNQYKVWTGATVPVGVGVNVRLAEGMYANLESGYRFKIAGQTQNHLQHVAGLAYWFQPGYKVPVEDTTRYVFIDTDRDGITDSLDKCPTIAGLPNFDGCPDSDGDGVADNNDACPLVAGLVALNGCPDSDGDGLNDKDDQCPYVAGTVANNGCPPPDRDNDGFLDTEDRCPDTYSKTNGGCPEIRQEIINQVSKAAKAIFFETGKATLKKTSYKSLDAVVNILQNDPSLYADIEGHTDAVGDDASNLTLSQNRAAAVRDYFVSKGIDGSRLTSQGFGETQPVATNETAAGKAQNRRTEIKLRNYAK